MAAYFEMLELELRRQPFNKSEYRRRLLPLLDGRSEGAVEFKHQNISAVLLEVGFDWIDGYKPSGNYQELLRQVVLERLQTAHTLHALVEKAVVEDEGLRVPTVDDFERFPVDPPALGAARTGTSGTIHRESRPQYGGPLNYRDREEKNRRLGLAGEEFVLALEAARLRRIGRDDLAGEIVHTSVHEGDHVGYDVRSFEPDGRPRLIEVKTTTFGLDTPFFVSENQVVTSRDQGTAYHLYRVFRFRRDPKLFTLRGALDDVCRLEPVKFRARASRA